MEKTTVLPVLLQEIAAEHGGRLPPRGLVRAQAAAAKLTIAKRVAFFSSVFLVSFVLGLDFLARNSYAAFATSSFQQHSLLATVNVIRGVVAAASQPSIARLTDVFGRIEVFTVAIVFIVVGTILQTFSSEAQSFSGGAVLQALGYRISTMAIEIMIADFTSVKARLLFAFTVNWPHLVNTWVSGDVVKAVLSVATWRWGLGMFAIIIPVCSIPLITFMFLLERKSQPNNGSEGEHRAAHSKASKLPSPRQLFWDIDAIGVSLLTGALAMTLIPLTLAGGQVSKWREPGTLAPLIFGIILFPVFGFWESKVTTPLFPLHLLRNRSVWAGLGIGCLGPLAFTIHGNYLFTLLMVSYDFSVKDATRISFLYSFCSTLIGSILGFVVFKLRRLKPFVISGTALWFAGAGMIYHYRGGVSSKAGLIGGEVIIGCAAGFFSWPTFVLVQAATPHRYLSVAISLIFTANSLGQAVGNCVVGAIWTQTLYKILSERLAAFDERLAPAVYASPLQTVPQYPIGTPVRDAIVESYRSIQRSLTIAAICFHALAFILAWVLYNPKLSSEQTSLRQKMRTKSTLVGGDL
ncbi:MFS general substrate transporter [Sarocladium strictum]